MACWNTTETSTSYTTSTSSPTSWGESGVSAASLIEWLCLCYDHDWGHCVAISTDLMDTMLIIYRYVVSELLLSVEILSICITQFRCKNFWNHFVFSRLFGNCDVIFRNNSFKIRVSSYENLKAEKIGNYAYKRGKSLLFA